IQTVTNRPGRACGRTRSHTVPSLTLVTRTWHEPGADPPLVLQQHADALRQAVPYLVSQEALSPPRTRRCPRRTHTQPPVRLSRPADMSRPSNPPVHPRGAISLLPQEQTSASRHEASTSIRCNGLVDTPRTVANDLSHAAGRERPECPFGAQ